MTYVVRLGYPNTPDGRTQFGVEAVASSDDGQTWDLQHRYILATWTGAVKGDKFWYCSVQGASTVLLADETLMTAFGTGFRNTPASSKCIMDIALVGWRME
jgi:hypothetical protein